MKRNLPSTAVAFLALMALVGTSSDNQADLQTQYQEKAIAFKRFQEDTQRTLADAQKKELADLRKRLMPVITQLGKEKGYTVIFDKFNAGLVFAGDTVDVTDEVLKRFDAIAAMPAAAAAKDEARPASPGPTQMMVVNLERLVKDSILGKEASARIKKIEDQNKQEEDKLAKDLREMEQRLASQGPSRKEAQKPTQAVAPKAEAEEEAEYQPRRWQPSDYHQFDRVPSAGYVPPARQDDQRAAAELNQQAAAELQRKQLEWERAKLAWERAKTEEARQQAERARQQLDAARARLQAEAERQRAIAAQQAPRKAPQQAPASQRPSTNQEPMQRLSISGDSIGSPRNSGQPCEPCIPQGGCPSRWSQSVRYEVNNPNPYAVVAYMEVTVGSSTSHPVLRIGGNQSRSASDDYYTACSFYAPNQSTQYSIRVIRSESQ